MRDNPYRSYTENNVCFRALLSVNIGSEKQTNTLVLILAQLAVNLTQKTMKWRGNAFLRLRLAYLPFFFHQISSKKLADIFFWNRQPKYCVTSRINQTLALKLCGCARLYCSYWMIFVPFRANVSLNHETMFSYQFIVIRHAFQQKLNKNGSFLPT